MSGVAGRRARAPRSLRWGTAALVLGALGCGGEPKDPGEQGYQNLCAYCHHQDGTGTRTGPPLGDPWLAKEALGRIILHGMDGPVTVQHKDASGKAVTTSTTRLMAPLGQRLSDEEAAAIMTYVQARFGKGGAPVTAAEVKKIRDATKDRTLPWTAAELEPFTRSR